MDTDERGELIKALKLHYNTPDVVFGKGGFFVRGIGFISLAQARKVTGITAATRNVKGKTGGYGDYATIRKIAGRM